MVPVTPQTSPFRGPLSTDSSLEVDWNFITDSTLTGGSPIITYSLFIDDGNGGSFSEVCGDTISNYTQNSIIISSGIQSGFTYRVKYMVGNIYGFSPFSPISTITAMTIPGAPTSVVVANDQADVQITWQSPAFTGGNSIALTSYIVQVESNITGVF